MLSGKVDATLGGFWNVEGVELRQRDAAALDRARSTGSGVPDYDELVLVANSDKLDEQRDDLRLFISAVAAGRPRRAREPARRPRSALLDANRDLKAQGPPATSVRVTIPALFPRSRAGRGATWTRSPGATTAAGWSTTAC